jgi:hypothetical protein
MKINIEEYLVELENGERYHILGEDIRDVLNQCIKKTPDIAVSLIAKKVWKDTYKKVWRNTEDEC